MTNLAHDTTNDTRFSDFKSVVHELGRDAASGGDALPNLAITFARAVADGVIDIKPDASGKDGAARVFDWYATSAGKKAVHDRTENGTKAQISKLRQLGKAANTPKWDFVNVLNRGIVVRRDLADDGIEVKPAYAAYVDIAREQLKHDDELTDGQLADVVKKVASEKDVTLESKLKQVNTILEGIITGEKWEGVQDQSPEVLAAAAQIKERYGQVMALREKQEKLDNALKDGVISQEEYELKLAA